MRLSFRIAFFMFLLLLALAFFTNPGLKEFTEKVKGELNMAMPGETNNASSGIIAEMGSEFVDGMINKLVTRKNYFVCSIYLVEMPDGDYRYLGAFYTFFPLQDKNPLEMLKLN